MQLFPPEETTFLFEGPNGAIEVLTASADIEKPIGNSIICHPHPLHGGTMNNKVVTTIAKAFRELGLRTVRFNFRGVGKSAGVYDEGIGETDDVLTLADWLKSQFPLDPLWLGGFSFGGYVAAKAATRLSIKQLVSVAPQASRFVDSPLSSIPSPWLIIQGEKDEIIPPEEVYHFVEISVPKPTLIRLPNAGHFFHGKLLELRKALMTLNVEG